MEPVRENLGVKNFPVGVYNRLPGLNSFAIRVACSESEDCFLASAEKSSRLIERRRRWCRNKAINGNYESSGGITEESEKTST